MLFFSRNFVLDITPYIIIYDVKRKIHTQETSLGICCHKREEMSYDRA